MMDIDSPEMNAMQQEKSALQMERKAELARLETAKSWIRANVVAKEETYNALDAKFQLGRFPPPLINEALKALITERVISMGNRGRTTPGRNFNLTELFLTTLGRRRAIDVTILPPPRFLRSQVQRAKWRYLGPDQLG
jgi:transcription factor C subunit 3